MLVIYNEPRQLSLPYDDKGKQIYFDFKPGDNIIKKEIWDKIIEQNKDDFLNCYGVKFKVMEGQVNPETGIETAKSDTVNIAGLTIRDMTELIEHTTEIDTLKEYKEKENKRSTPRKGILKIIKEQIESINDLTAK